MIVDPDFMDHWRTGMVADAIGDQMAPVYILRLWAHCQERKSDRFVMPTRGLKAQCKFPGDAEVFEAALIEAGFVERVDAEVVVCGWADKNAALIAAWANGSKGGRAKKEPSGNPQEAKKEPKANPDGTQQEPTGNPDGTHEQAIRVEKIREEPPIPPKGAKPAAVGLKTWLESIAKAGETPIPESDPVFGYAEEVGIPLDFLRLAWLEFRHRYCQPDAKRYRDWRSVFRKSVRGNWGKLWWLDPSSNQYELTTVGKQAQRVHQERKQA